MVLKGPLFWPQVASIHGEINPYGWLTMLIYGMTYAVLRIAANLRLARAWMGWLHLSVAQAAVIVVTFALAWNSSILYLLGVGLQAVAPILFLTNILSAVADSRLRKREAAVRGESDPTEPWSQGSLSVLARTPIYQASDRIAQRGTDLALMLFVVANVWWFVTLLVQGKSFGAVPDGAMVLVSYGWIGGTVLSVALHLFPRFTNVQRVSSWAMFGGQLSWFVGVVLTSVGEIGLPLSLTVGSRLLGASAIWNAMLQLNLLRRRNPKGGLGVQQSIVAWYAAWLFLFALGIALLLGVGPLSLVSFHLLFLGWSTTLVYGIGYTVFPLLLGFAPSSLKRGLVQVGGSVSSACLMALAFSGMASHVATIRLWLGILAVGGALATISALGFMLVWLFAYRGRNPNIPWH